MLYIYTYIYFPDIINVNIYYLMAIELWKHTRRGFCTACDRHVTVSYCLKAVSFILENSGKSPDLGCTARFQKPNYLAYVPVVKYYNGILYLNACSSLLLTEQPLLLGEESRITSTSPPPQQWTVASLITNLQPAACWAHFCLHDNFLSQCWITVQKF